MNTIVYITILCLWAANAQENSMANVPKSLLECYNNTYLLDRNNKLPQNIPSLLAILRKIEDTPGLNMDLRTLSVALLHRFRQDGIVQNPYVPVQTGVTPYAPNGFQFFRQAETLKLIPGNAISFPNDSLSSVERCSLHSMVSSSIDMFERGDESVTCRNANSPYRYPRSLKKRSSTQSSDLGDDVETLTAEQLEILNNKDDASKHTDVDPNSWYPPLPPNHPDSAKLFALPPQSRCPIENGVIKTEWGAIAGGSILAGIAAGVQPQNVKLGVLLREEWQSRDALSSTTLDNKWIATIAGDLAEVALRQGPLADKPMTLGVDGHWNSSFMPRWYLLNSNEDLFYTAAEIRGDLDGLILASEIGNWYSRVPNLRLSQIIDMYYSDRGVFNTTVRACNRKNLLISVAPNDTTTAQAFRSALVLSPGVAKVTIDPATIERFAVQATEKLFSFIPSMDDPACGSIGNDVKFNRISTDLTIVLDTNWPFDTVQPMLAALLERLDVSKYNSNFTVISGVNGSAMINSSNSILNFYEFNETQYSSFVGPFNLPKSLIALRSMENAKLNEEKNRGSGGGKSEVILIVPYTSTISDEDKEFCKDQLRILREEVPDATFKFLASRVKDPWSDLVQDPNDDIFLIGTVSSAQDISTPIDSLLSSIKRVPRRLINSRCGSDYKQSEPSSSSYEDYLEPMGINFYRLQPNYFYRSDAESYATITIQAPVSADLEVCTSRDLSEINSTTAECKRIAGNSHSVCFNCENSGFIHKCRPLYLSVRSNSPTNTAYQCTDNRFCRYPDMVKYTISYENLVCASSACTAIISPIVLVFITIYSYLR